MRCVRKWTAASLLLAAATSTLFAQHLLVDPIPIRSEVMRATDPEKTYNYDNFPGLLYDMDTKVYCETLVVRVTKPDKELAAVQPPAEPTEGRVEERVFGVGRVQGVKVKNAGFPENGYSGIEADGKRYMLPTKDGQKAALVLVDFGPDEERAIISKKSWDLGGGYRLDCYSLDWGKRRAFLRLFHGTDQLAEYAVDAAEADPQKRLLVWRREGVSEAGPVVWFAALVDRVERHNDAGQVDELGQNYVVVLKHVWLAAWDLVPTPKPQTTTRSRIGRFLSLTQPNWAGGNRPPTAHRLDWLPKGRIPAEGIVYTSAVEELPLSIDSVRGVELQNRGCAPNSYRVVPFIGRKCMALGGVPAKAVPVVYEQARGTVQRLPEGATWYLPDGFSLTATEIDRRRASARLVLRHDSQVAADQTIRITRDPNSPVMAWYRNALGESDVLWFTAYVSGMGDDRGERYLSLQHVWLCGWQPVQHRIGDNYGRLSISGISHRAIALKNPQDIPITYGSRIRLTDELWLEVAADDPFRMTFVRMVRPTVRAVSEAAIPTAEESPARRAEGELWERTDPWDVGDLSELLSGLGETVGREFGAPPLH